jgi:hypothetical protein
MNIDNAWEKVCKDSSENPEDERHRLDQQKNTNVKP